MIEDSEIDRFVFYWEDTDRIEFSFTDIEKVIAVDARKRYNEIPIGDFPAGNHTFNAPYKSDWALAIEYI